MLIIKYNFRKGKLAQCSSSSDNQVLTDQEWSTHMVAPLFCTEATHSICFSRPSSPCILSLQSAKMSKNVFNFPSHGWCTIIQYGICTFASVTCQSFCVKQLIYFSPCGCQVDPYTAVCVIITYFLSICVIFLNIWNTNRHKRVESIKKKLLSWDN